MDEHPVQLTGETRIPVPEKPGHPRRYDYEYERHGTAANFLFLEPLTGRRKVHVRERRTAVDWAYEIQELLEVDYPDAQVVVLVCDNLSTHTIASLYKAFPPEKARSPAKRLELHYTPKHGVASVRLWDRSWVLRNRHDYGDSKHMTTAKSSVFSLSPAIYFLLPKQFLWMNYSVRSHGSRTSHQSHARDAGPYRPRRVSINPTALTIIDCPSD